MLKNKLKRKSKRMTALKVEEASLVVKHSEPNDKGCPSPPDSVSPRSSHCQSWTLGKDDIDVIQHGSTVSILPPGSVIIEKGSSSERFFLISRGIARVETKRYFNVEQGEFSITTL